MARHHLVTGYSARMADNETQPDLPADDVLPLPGWVLAAIRSELLADPGEDDDPGD